MKKKRPRLLSLAVLFVGWTVAACVGFVPIPVVPAAPHWFPDQRLTYNPASSQTTYNFARSIAADSSGNIDIVWFDTRDGTTQVYFKRSGDGGVTWGPDTRISLGSVGGEHPSIARGGQNVDVAWHDFRNGKPDVYVRHSADGGTTWGPETLITRWAGDGEQPSIAVSGPNVRVVYGSGRDGEAEVYTAASTDNGETWGGETRVSDAPYDSWVATVELSGPNVYVAWVDTATRTRRSTSAAPPTAA